MNSFILLLAYSFEKKYNKNTNYIATGVRIFGRRSEGNSMYMQILESAFSRVT